MMPLRWEYLLTPAFQSRYVLAAHYVRDCPVVVEVGSWKNSVADHLSQHRTVVTIDPYAEPRPSQAAVNCVRKPLQDVDTSFLRGQNYGLVFLGFELVGERSGIAVAMEKFINMANDSKVVVVEYAERHALAAGQVAEFVHRCNKREYLRVRLDLSGNAVPSEGFPPFFERVFIVFKEGKQ